MQIDQTNLGLSREYLVKGIENKYVKAYLEFMVDIAEILGADRKKASEELLESLKFEIKLANVNMNIETSKQLFPSFMYLDFITKRGKTQCISTL